MLTRRVSINIIVDSHLRFVSQRNSGRLGNREARTSCVGEIILLPLNSVLQSFGFATSLLNSRLHSLGGDITVALGVHRDRPVNFCCRVVLRATGGEIGRSPRTKGRCREMNRGERRRYSDSSRAQVEQQKRATFEVRN